MTTDSSAFHRTMTSSAPETTRTVICKNLHPDVTPAILYELFLQAGRVEMVRRPVRHNKGTEGAGDRNPLQPPKNTKGMEGAGDRTQLQPTKEIREEKEPQRQSKERMFEERSDTLSEHVESPLEAKAVEEGEKLRANVESPLEAKAVVEGDKLGTNVESPLEAKAVVEGDKLGTNVESSLEATAVEEGDKLAMYTDELSFGIGFQNELKTIPADIDVEGAQKNLKSSDHPDEIVEAAVTSWRRSERGNTAKGVKDGDHDTELDYQPFAFVTFHHTSAASDAIRLFRTTKLFGKPMQMLMHNENHPSGLEAKRRDVDLLNRPSSVLDQRPEKRGNACHDHRRREATGAAIREGHPHVENSLNGNRFSDVSSQFSHDGAVVWLMKQRQEAARTGVLNRLLCDDHVTVPKRYDAREARQTAASHPVSGRHDNAPPDLRAHSEKRGRPLCGNRGGQASTSGYIGVHCPPQRRGGQASTSGYIGVHCPQRRGGQYAYDATSGHVLRARDGAWDGGRHDVTATGSHAVHRGTRHRGAQSGPVPNGGSGQRGSDTRHRSDGCALQDAQTFRRRKTTENTGEGSNKIISRLYVNASFGCDRPSTNTMMPGYESPAPPRSRNMWTHSVNPAALNTDLQGTTTETRFYPDCPIRGMRGIRGFRGFRGGGIRGFRGSSIYVGTSKRGVPQ